METFCMLLSEPFVPFLNKRAGGGNKMPPPSFVLAIHLAKNKLDGWKLKTKFDIQYSMSVVRYVGNVFYLCGCWVTGITY